MKSKVCVACGTAATVSVRLTGTAAVKLESPAWLATTVHVPALSRLSALPLTVHTAGVLDAKLTARPELAVAARATGVLPTVPVAARLKLMVCDCAAGATVKDRVTTGAAATLALPGWLAFSVQVPAATRPSALPLTVHTAGVLELSVTGRPELAVADSTAAGVPRVWVPGAVKLMVCAAGAMVNEFSTALAAAKLALPGWLAATVQVPAASRFTAAPLTMQTAGVELAKATGKPELAVATSTGTLVPSTWVPGAGKEMFCAAICAATTKLCGT